jgi:hypothetical protein
VTAARQVTGSLQHPTTAKALCRGLCARCVGCCHWSWGAATEHTHTHIHTHAQTHTHTHTHTRTHTHAHTHTHTRTNTHTHTRTHTHAHTQVPEGGAGRVAGAPGAALGRASLLWGARVQKGARGEGCKTFARCKGRKENVTQGERDAKKGASGASQGAQGKGCKGHKARDARG